MTAYQTLQNNLPAEPRTWLITGVAGFIGSHLLEKLLQLGQRVVGLDNFASGAQENLQEVRHRVGSEAWEKFVLHQGSVADLAACRAACAGVDLVLHHAGFVSVPLSIENPLACHETNVTGTLHVLLAARDAGVRRVVYASSSAVYGDDPRLPKSEAQIGRPLSPYGASKLIGEMQARLFSQHYGLESVGLRYFNIFGPRQNPAGGYAAVIPGWILALLAGERCLVHGDGSTTRDFCGIGDVVQANLLAATAPGCGQAAEVFNVALGARTSLDQLYRLLAREAVALTGTQPPPLAYGPPRAGDIQHSGADIGEIVRRLHYAPGSSLEAGLAETIRWYYGRQVEKAANRRSAPEP